MGIADILVERNLYGFVAPAKNLGVGNPVDILDLVHNLPIGYLPHAVDAAAAPNLDGHEHVVELLQVELKYLNHELAGEILFGLINLLYKLEVGVLKVGVFLIGDLDTTLLLSCRGNDLLYPFECANGSLERDNSLVLHVLGIHLQPGAHLHKKHGKRCVGVELNGKLLVRYVPKHAEPGEQHGDKYFSFYNKVH